MAIVSFIVFAVGLAVAGWTIWSSIAPQRARILDLLLNGPVPAERVALHVPARSTLRSVRVRPVRASIASTARRAAA